MSKFRTSAIALATAAVAAVPLVAGGAAGAQDAGDCGEGATVVTSEQLNLGGLAGAVAPLVTQVVTPLRRAGLLAERGELQRERQQGEQRWWSLR